MDDTSRGNCALRSPTADNTRIDGNVLPSVKTAQVFSCRIPRRSKQLLSLVQCTSLSKPGSFRYLSYSSVECFGP
eukprot:860158-Amphidinium_carterae.1